MHSPDVTWQGELAPTLRRQPSVNYVSFELAGDPCLFCGCNLGRAEWLDAPVSYRGINRDGAFVVIMAAATRIQADCY